MMSPFYNQGPEMKKILKNSWLNLIPNHNVFRELFYQKAFLIVPSLEFNSFEIKRRKEHNSTLTRIHDF